MPLYAQCPDGAPPPCRVVMPPRGAGADSHVIAVLPFRVSGADTSLAEGLAELLALEYTGEGVQRSADMGTVLRAWRSAGGGARLPLDLAAARRVATRVGAGRLVTASVVATGRQLTVSAQVIGTGDGAVKVRAGPIRGSIDSLPEVLRELAAQLIGTSAGVRSGLGSVPTDALRAFIAGRAAYRRSEWIDAAQAFNRAIELDSTFAYAALGRIQSDGWATLPDRGDTNRIKNLLWRYRDRLDPVSQALATSRLGIRHPRQATVVEALEAKGAVVRLAPDNAEAWFALGDELAHRGDLVASGSLQRARAAFERAFELDSGLSEAPIHLSSLGTITGQPALTRAAAPHALRIAPNTPWVVLLHYDAAIAEGRGRRFADSMIANMRSLTASAINLIHLHQSIPERLDTALIEAAFAERTRRATTVAERRQLGIQRALWLLNRGRPGAAENALAPLEPADVARVRIEYALFSSGDSAAAAAAASLWLDAPGDAPAARQRRLCALGMWSAHLGDMTGAARQASALRATSQDDTDVSAWCAPLLDAAIATREQRADARALVASADSIVAQGMPSIAGWEGLALGRFWAQLGDFTAATRAVRRVEWFGSGRTGSGLHLAERLRSEGQWAARSGDTEGARVAYRRYLILRSTPEPVMHAQRDSVVAELGRLQ